VVSPGGDRKHASTNGSPVPPFMDRECTSSPHLCVSVESGICCEAVVRLRTLALAGVAGALLMLVPSTSLACSAVACIDNGPEFRPTFEVAVRHDGRPFRGATVEILSYAEGKPSTRFSGVTTSNGVVRFRDLPAGKYWLNTELMGVTAAYHCFHIAQRSSRIAKVRVTYEWGNFALATRQVTGSLIDSQPGTGESPLWNLVHRRNLPIVGATLKLQDAFTGRVFISTSDMDGAFGFDTIPEGLYVLRVEGGRSNREFESADKLIRVSPKAKGSRLTLTKHDAGGGDCGGTVLELAN
jgi:hypothetical protein